MARLFAQIAAGIIDVSPYYKGGSTPCGYCKYKTFCRFEGGVPEGGQYRFLPRRDNAEIMEEIRSLYREGDEGSE